MKLLDIAPFVRFSMQFTFIPQRDAFTSLDCRLFYITEGEGKITLDGIVHKISADTLLLWQAGTVYQFDCQKPINVIALNFDYTSENCEHTAYYQPIRIPPPDDSILPSCNVIFFEDQAHLNSPIVLYKASFFREGIEKILADWSNQSPFYLAKTSALLKESIVDVVQKISLPISDPEILRKLQKIVLYIGKHYNEQLTNNHLAELVGYHPYYLNRIFLQYKGVTLHQYFINYRMTAAENLLITTDLSVSEISALTGFTSTVAFTINFKKKNIITPSQFRKKHNGLI